MTRRRSIASWVIAFGLLATGPLSADCAKPTNGVATGQTVNNVKVLAADDGGTVCQSCIDTASEAWNNSCEINTKPSFVGSNSPESAQITAFVRFQDGANPGSPDCSSSKCACANVSFDPNGAIALATIRIWESAPGQNCVASASAILTHEFAHVLGLDDPPTGCSCSNIMGDVNGAIDGQVCGQVDDNFKTDKESLNLDDDDHPCHPQKA